MVYVKELDGFFLSFFLSFKKHVKVHENDKLFGQTKD